MIRLLRAALLATTMMTLAVPVALAGLVRMAVPDNGLRICRNDGVRAAAVRVHHDYAGPLP